MAHVSQLKVVRTLLHILPYLCVKYLSPQCHKREDRLIAHVTIDFI